MRASTLALHFSDVVVARGNPFRAVEFVALILGYVRKGWHTCVSTSIQVTASLTIHRRNGKRKIYAFPYDLTYQSPPDLCGFQELRAGHKNMGIIAMTCVTLNV